MSDAAELTPDQRLAHARARRASKDAAGAIEDYSILLGASPDPVDAVKRFHDKQGLNFSLLADEDHAVADSYGVWREKSMYGKTFWGVQRATFIIDADGRVAHVIPKVSPKTHDEEALAALANLRDAA